MAMAGLLDRRLSLVAGVYRQPPRERPRTAPRNEAARRRPKRIVASPSKNGIKEGEMHPGEHDELQAIRSELEGLRVQVDAAGSGAGRSWWGRATTRPRPLKRLTRVGLVALMLALPV